MLSPRELLCHKNNKAAQLEFPSVSLYLSVFQNSAALRSSEGPSDCFPLLLLKNTVQNLSLNVCPMRKEGLSPIPKYFCKCLPENKLSNFWQPNSRNIS